MNWRDRLIASRHWILAAVYVVIFSFAYAGAFLLRFDFQIPQDFQVVFGVTVPVVVGIKLLVFTFTGQLHGWWRVVTFQDLVAIGFACVVSLLVLASASFFTNSISVPRSVLVLDIVLTLMIVGGLRSSFRLFAEYVHPVVAAHRYTNAALIGSDPETLFLAGQIRSHGRLPLNVSGLIELQNGSNTGRQREGGIPILGMISALEQLIAKHHIKVILVHTDLLPGKQMRQVMDICNRMQIQLQIVPRFEDRMNGTGTIPTRDINIEDLLRRDPARLDLASIREIVAGKCALVTGAGGSIGSEISRQLLAFGPSTLVLLGRGENRIYHIDQELSARNGSTVIETVIADIRDQTLIEQVFRKYRPDIVFHAAAHKHVPLMEKSIREAIVNNVIGTRVVCDAADKFGASRFVLISSDKAVRPTSVMGATKRMAEKYVQCVAKRSPTRFMTVRFGNVLGSAGSVVPLFKKQIKRGGPITVTDERMTRFFMTIPEASQLVLQAAAFGTGGDLFVLDMGTPIRIVDLARDMIRLSGLPESAIEIAFTGIRPGEKMHEELADDEGEISETAHPKIMSVQPLSFSQEAFDDMLTELMSPQHEADSLRAMLLSIDGNQEIAAVASDDRAITVSTGTRERQI